MELKLEYVKIAWIFAGGPDWLILILTNEDVNAQNKGFYKPTWLWCFLPKWKFKLSGRSHLKVWFGCRHTDASQRVSLVTSGCSDGTQRLWTELSFTHLDEKRVRMSVSRLPTVVVLMAVNTPQVPGRGQLTHLSHWRETRQLKSRNQIVRRPHALSLRSCHTGTKRSNIHHNEAHRHSSTFKWLKVKVKNSSPLT